MLKEFKGYKKGVDFGGWLSQCNHTKDRYDNFITEKDFANAASWGIDHVRVPVDYNLVETEVGEYIEKGFEYIQSAIDWCGKYGLNMILDLHKTYGFSFDKGENEAGFFENEEYQERFYKLWEQFAERFGKYSDRVAFELLNEVTDKDYCRIWNEISNKCVKRIRAYSADVKILIGGYWNNSAAAVKDIAMPADENIVYNFHDYDPLVFTHQGAYWVDGMPLDFRMSFDNTYAQIKSILHEFLPERENEFAFPADMSGKLDAEYFKQVFAEPVRIAEERGVSLYCGEYGVIDRANSEDILKWYRAIHEAFEYYGIGRATWNYKEMDFGLTDARLDNVRDEIIKLL